MNLPHIAIALLATQTFVHVPGPNPILTCGTPGAWDESVIETCDAFKEGGTYYLFYHGVPKDKARWGPGGYRLGLAAAAHPLGPWKKLGDRPVLEVGPAGSWDDHHVACAMIVKEAPGRFIMWYSGYNRAEQAKPKPARHISKWDIGLAFASKPEGPWTKYDQNPILRDFGYVGGVVKRNGRFFLYTEHPIGSTAPDYGPISVATADKPEGPWTVWKDNPALPPSERGAWDDGGCSEAEVFWRDGQFHLFYGGAKEYQPRMKTRESIGYATSRDGFRFMRHAANPVAPRESQPNAAAFAEVHTLVESPFIYAFHTLRYIDPAHVPRAKGRTSVLEDIGVQVLATRRPFTLPMPVMTLESLAASTATELGDCPPICLGNIARVSLSIECKFSTAARKGLTLRVRGSNDGLAYDSTDILTCDLDCLPGGISRKSVELKTKPPFIKVLVENRDEREPTCQIKVTATLGG
ncbi:MAG: hypothetical protein HZC54_06090 [Verrucomicrobia bacterium]|nr:hypothetical protein [Verrucomicrobiota bacterium]